MFNRSTKRIGLDFERDFKIKCDFQNVCAVNLPDKGAEVINQMGLRKVILKPIICDYILLYKGDVAFIDCKSVNDTRMPYSKFYYAGSSTYNQMTEFQKIREKTKEDRHVPCGFAIFFEPLGQVSFFDVSLVEKLEPRMSLDPKKEGIHLGSTLSYDVRKIYGKSEESY